MFVVLLARCCGVSLLCGRCLRAVLREFVPGAVQLCSIAAVLVLVREVGVLGVHVPASPVSYHVLLV